MSLLIPIEEIYDAATDDECLERLALSLTESLGARSGVVHWRNLQTDTGGISISGYFSEEQMAEYDRHFADCDLWAEAFAANGSANRVWSSEQLVSSRAYEGSRIYNDWIRAMGDDSFRCLGAGIRTDVLVADIGFHRARSQPAFEEAEIGQLTQCVGHLQRMMTIRSRVNAAEQAQASVAGALDSIGYGLFTLGTDGRVLHCNRGAEIIVERGDGLIIKAGRLNACGLADQKALAEAYERASAPTQPEASALRIMRSGGGHYELSIVSMHAGFAGRQLLVTVTDPDGRDDSLAARLRTLYALSASEAEVAIRISEGASLAQLAEERRTAIGTIRNQTKAVAEKLGCGRQAEIVALVKSLPPLRAAD
jgi:DNA-binding CsgD family transcriptional regulator